MSALLFARKDLERLRAAPTGLLVWISIPLLIGAMVALAGGGGGGRMQVNLLIADADDSVGSRMLTSALQQSGIVRTEMVDAEVGRARVAAGDASALLSVPRGFAAAVLRREPTELRLLTNPSQRIMPGIAATMLQTGTEVVFCAQQLLGPAWDKVARDVADQDSAEAWALAGSGVGIELQRRVRAVLDPPRIEFVDRSPPQVETDADPDAGGGGFGRRFWPGMLMMALFFAGQGLGEDLWEERRLGTLRRAMLAPGGVRPWLLGKLLCAAAVAALVGIVGLGGGVAMFDLPARTLWLGVPWMAVVGAAIVLLLWPLICVASSARAANVLTSAVMFPLLMLGGSFFPFEWMPAWMARIGSVTPNGWLLLRLRELVDDRAEPWSLVAGVAAVALLAALVLPFCARRLRRAVAG